MKNSILRVEVVAFSLLLVLMLLMPGDPIIAQLRTEPMNAALLTSGSSSGYPLLIDTTAEWWIEHHIAVSSCHYIGVELGFTHAWMSGAHNFYFPFQSANTNASAPMQLPFGALGFGEGAEIGGVVDYSVSDFFGLQGKLRYFSNSTKATSESSQFITDRTGASAFSSVTSTYSLSQNFLGADALLRYQIVPQEYYALGGFSAGVPITQTFSNTVLMQPITGAHAGAPATSASMDGPISPSYINSFRLDARFGVGTFIPITEEMVVTPELMLTIPLTSPISGSSTAGYQSAGVITPRLWSLTASITVKFPNGGFSLYATERERERQYREQFRVAQLQHPMPLLKHFEFQPAAFVVKQPEFPPIIKPDYESDSVARLIRWEDVGATSGEKLRLVAFFASGKAELSVISYPDLDRLAQVMLKHQEMEVQIAAYTDIVGSYKKNVLLSQERAENVKLYMIRKGVDGDRLPAHGYGPEHPVATNATPGGRASNRRVEFIVMNPKSAMLEEKSSGDSRGGQ